MGLAQLNNGRPVSPARAVRPGMQIDDDRGAWAGKMVLVTKARSGVSQQQDLFGDEGPWMRAEPVLMALHAEYYELIWRGLKTHEFRRRFLEGRPARWFVYLNAPVSRLAAVIDLGPAVVDAPEKIAAIAEQARAGNGASVLEYVKDLDRAFAIPILHIAEYPGLPAGQMGNELGGFHPPQGYIRLNQHPRLLAVCEKIAAGTPVREMPVHHR